MQKRWVVPLFFLTLGLQTLGAMGSECAEKTQACLEEWQKLDAGRLDNTMCGMCESVCQEAQTMCVDHPKKRYLETASAYLRGCKNMCSDKSGTLLSIQ